MATTRIAITLDDKTVDRLDHLVKDRVLPNRSKAIREAVQEKLERLERGRLARECARLGPEFEKGLAEQGMSEELTQWPEYREGRLGGQT